jgi:hypothetical protein
MAEAIVREKDQVMPFEMPTENEAIEEFYRTLRESMTKQFGSEEYADAFITGSMRPLIEAIEQQLCDHHRMLKNLSITVFLPTDEEIRQRISRLYITSERGST